MSANLPSHGEEATGSSNQGCQLKNIFIFLFLVTIQRSHMLKKYVFKFTPWQTSSPVFQLKTQIKFTTDITCIFTLFSFLILFNFSNFLETDYRYDITAI